MRKIIKRYLRKFIKITFRKIIRNRKIIAFFLAFTISFSLVSNYKQEKPKAEIITLTTGTIIACAALATAMGVVITNPYMLQDVGTRVYEGIKNIPNAIENLGDRIKVNANKQVFDAVLTVAKALPTITTTIEKFGNIISKGSIYNISYSLKSLGFTSSRGILNLTDLGVADSSGYTYLGLGVRGYNYNLIQSKINEDVELVYDFSDYSESGKLRFTVNGTYRELSTSGFINKNSSIEDILSYVFISGYMDNVSFKYRVNSIQNIDNIDIPYTEENSKSVSADLPQIYFPSGTGSISVPIDYPLDNYSPSVSAPISKPTDLVLEDAGVVISSDTVTDDVVDSVGDNVGDNVGTGEGTLTGVGDSILNPTFDKTLDFSPLYIDLSKKFPFSIPWDFYNLFNDFEVSKKRPVVIYTFPEKYFNSYELKIDLAFYDDIFPFTTILRYFLLIAFVYFLIIKTRNLIGG